MVLNFYCLTFLLSITLTLVYTIMWHRSFNLYITLVFLLVPIVDLGYVMLARARSLDAALFGNQITYLGGCFLLPFIMLSAFQLCDLQYKKWLSRVLIIFSAFIYLSSLTIGFLPIFYKSVDATFINGKLELIKEYGPLHTLFYAMMIIYFLISLGVSLYSFFFKKSVSNKVVGRLLITELISIISFFGGRMITKEVEFVPLAYVFDQIIYLSIVHRMSLYDVVDTGIEALVQSGDTGLVSFDKKYRFLCANKTAMDLFPELYNIKVDTAISGNKGLEDTILTWIREFDKSSGTNNKFLYKKDDKSYFIEINNLSQGKRKAGYQIFVKDNTREQEYIAMLSKYNANLQTKLDEMYTMRGNK